MWCRFKAQQCRCAKIPCLILSLLEPLLNWRHDTFTLHFLIICSDHFALVFSGYLLFAVHFHTVIIHLQVVKTTEYSFNQNSHLPLFHAQQNEKKKLQMTITRNNRDRQCAKLKDMTFPDWWHQHIHELSSRQKQREINQLTGSFPPS